MGERQSRLGAWPRKRGSREGMRQKGEEAGG